MHTVGTKYDAPSTLPSCHPPPPLLARLFYCKILAQLGDFGRQTRQAETRQDKSRELGVNEYGIMLAGYRQKG